MTSPAVRARGLSKRFGPVSALRGLDLEISAGRACAVLGANGAGKSTLLRLVAGLSRPSDGWVEVGGARARGAAARARVGYVGHATLLYPELSARENLVFAGRLHGVADPGPRAEALLDEVDLAGAAERRAAGLSRGMAQRLSIARALVHDPPVLLLDEPFTGLDRPSADRLAERLSALRQGGRTLLLVTHDPLHAAALADCAALLSRGHLREWIEGPSIGLDELEGAWLRALEDPA